MRNLLCLPVLLVAASALPAADVDVTDLVKKLGSKDNEVRRAAARDLGDAGKDAKDAVPALTKALKDKDLYVRRFAAQALGKIGPDAKAAIKDLAALLNDDKEQVRKAAITALAGMVPASVPALTKALVKTPADVKEAAIAALGKAGTIGVPGLVSVIKDTKTDSSLRRRAVAALPTDETARPALAALTDAMKATRAAGREGRQLRLDSIAALGRLAKKDDKTVVAALEAITKNEKLRDMGLKNACRNALKRIQARK